MVSLGLVCFFFFFFEKKRGEASLKMDVRHVLYVINGLGR